MAIKDYYAILMVHPKAEAFVIEAAYKRLAREYHPDFSNASAHHEKMVEINEAYEVLSDPTKRRKYHREYEREARSQRLTDNTAKAARQPPPKKSQPNQQAAAAADSRWGNVSPVRPDPANYGIDDDYLAHAVEGAQAWQLREHQISNRVKWLTRIVSSLVGVGASVLLYRQPGWEQKALFAWLILPLLGELTISIIQRIRDAHLLRYKFNPLYNPNPTGYNHYAKDYAQYEAETVTVYVTKDSIFHARKDCAGKVGYEPLPKWFAIARNARACKRCGGALIVEVKKLPPPFGR